MKENIRDDFALALELGLVPNEPNLLENELEGIELISSDDFKTFQSAVEQINEKSKFVIFDSEKGENL